jgi:hypothetical protein
MQKTTALAVTALTLALSALTAPAAHAADGWQWLPIANDPGWKPEASLALTGNRVGPGTGPSASGWGLDLNFNCGLVQTPDQRIRSHVNFTHTSQNGTSVNAFELSPRYTVPLGDGLSAGFGPSVGAFQVSTPGNDRTLLGLGAAAGMNYRAGMLYTGFDIRYHATTSRGGIDHDPLTFGAKVGINF